MAKFPRPQYLPHKTAPLNKSVMTISTEYMKDYRPPIDTYLDQLPVYLGGG